MNNTGVNLNLNIATIIRKNLVTDKMKYTIKKAIKEGEKKKWTGQKGKNKNVHSSTLTN